MMKEKPAVVSDPSSPIHDHKALEPKWQKVWKEHKLFEVDREEKKPKYYILEMFPYPSGTIHMGHARNYTIGDVMARYKAARGFQVMHPMGWDAFGLPAENAAIKHKTHPAQWTISNIAYMRGQFEKMGWLFDWRREVTTCLPEYYKWEQLFFIEMLEKGLAYRKLSSVNWCVSCNTVLANEQVEEGKCWRCENEVTTKELTQWFFKVSAYAEELLAGCDQMPGWPDRVKTMQKNWIGKSLGAEVEFEIVDGALKGEKIKIFTTRPDTLAGVSFLSLAPEHPYVEKIVYQTAHESKVMAFVEKIRKIDKIKRSDEAFEKEGIALGAHVRNPLNGQVVPLFAANFVLMDYGSGAVMAVPAHDHRDHAFAKKYNLPITQVVFPLDSSSVDVQKSAYVEYGRLDQTSVMFSGKTSQEALTLIPQWLEQNKFGKPTVNYKLRDWGISRQRYWGAPIPVVHCEKCGAVPVNKNDLPVRLPDDSDDVVFTGEGASPLTKSESFLNTSCPKCHAKAVRETDTMDTFMESSWYYLKFCSLPDPSRPFTKEDLKYWGPIDQYIGGIEHATMHCLYFRFFHRVLQDLGWVPLEIGREPAINLLNQGIVYKDGAKMSKSKGNIVDPNAMIEKYGADTTRLFVLFAAPPEKVLEWSEAGIEGSYRFLCRVWRMMQINLPFIQSRKAYSPSQAQFDANLPDAAEIKKLRTKTHQTIQKVTLDLNEGFRFNTAISAIMELVNEIYLFKPDPANTIACEVLRESIESVIRLLNPFAPHLSEELWQMLGKSSLLSLEQWQDHDPKAVELDSLTIVVQVNGKLRANLSVAKKLALESKAELEQLAKNEPKVQSFLSGKEIVKTIVVPGKLVNFVVK